MFGKVLDTPLEYYRYHTEYNWDALRNLVKSTHREALLLVKLQALNCRNATKSLKASQFVFVRA